MAKPKSKDPIPDQKKRKILKCLPCILTDAERLKIGQDMAHEAQEIALAEQRKKEVVTQIGADIERHRASVSKCSSLINSGVEHRDVECEMTIDFRTGEATTVRLDTGELVERRSLRADEIQTEMPLSEAAVAADREAAAALSD